MSEQKMVSGFVTGKVTEISGVETIGKYEKRHMVVEYRDGEYTGQLALEFFGRNVPKAEGVSVGDSVTVHYNSKSRKSGSRWFSAHDAWKVDTIRRSSAPSGSGPYPPRQQTMPASSPQHTTRRAPPAQGPSHQDDSRPEPPPFDDSDLPF